MSVISKKNQITVPVDVLREAGVGPGDDMRAVVVGPGRIEFAKVDALIEQFAGVFDEEAYPEGYLEELRAEWP